MIAPLEISGLSKEFATPAGPYVAVKNVNAVIADQEFVCILGHSGCGKSTVLSVIAGLAQSTEGGVLINGTEVDAPGTDRGVVFQTPSLLPWLTVGENTTLAVNSAFPNLRHPEQTTRTKEILELLGILECIDQMPAKLSLGTQQLVSLARAISFKPPILLLDEPFSMLDSLTRIALQDTLLQVWEQTRNIVVMVTHDIDEALYLADRMILMTDGPAARVGTILTVPFGRPRDRSSMLNHPRHDEFRKQVMTFLETHARQFQN